MRSDELPSGKMWAVIPASDDDIGPKLIRDLRKHGIKQIAIFRSDELVAGAIWLPATLTALYLHVSAVELLAVGASAGLIRLPTKGLLRLLAAALGKPPK